MVDQLSVANWMFATVNRDENAEPLPYPEPLARPGLEGADAALPRPSDAATATPAEIAAFFSS